MLNVKKDDLLIKKEEKLNSIFVILEGEVQYVYLIFD